MEGEGFSASQQSQVSVLLSSELFCGKEQPAKS